MCASNVWYWVIVMMLLFSCNNNQRQKAIGNKNLPQVVTDSTGYSVSQTPHAKSFQELLLQGTIGKREAIMSLNILDDTLCSGYYFYLNELSDIEFSGMSNGLKEMNFTTLDAKNENSQPEKFHLVLSNNEYHGSYINEKDSLPINPKKIDATRIKTLYKKRLAKKFIDEDFDVVDLIKMSRIRFYKSSSSTNGLCTLVWYTDKYTGIKVPRIKTGYTEFVRNKINAKLKDIQLEEVFYSLECRNPQRRFNYSLEVDHLYCHPNVFSIDFYHDEYCGGAHPNWNWTAYNFNGKTGEILKFDNLFWFDKKKPPKENTTEWDAYHDTIVAPKLVAVLEKLYKKEMKDDCEYAMRVEVWRQPNWYFTLKGLYVGASDYHQACVEPEWSVVPYRLMQKWLSPKAAIRLPR